MFLKAYSEFITKWLLFFNVFNLRKTLVTKTIFLSLSGFLYGLIITLMECMTVMGMNVFIARYMTSIPFDINHMIGNAVIYIFLIYKLEDYITGKKKIMN